jgi:hypothetical protein
MTLPQAERDEIGVVLQAARLFRPSTPRGRERLAAAFAIIDGALRRADGRRDFPVRISTAALAVLRHPQADNEGRRRGGLMTLAPRFVRYAIGCQRLP